MKQAVALLAAASMLFSGCAGKTIDGGGSGASGAVAKAEGGTPPEGASPPEKPRRASTCVDAPAGTVRRLFVERNIAAPTGNAQGIAYDGSLLWIVAENSDQSTTTLLRFDPDNGTTERELFFQNLTETKGSSAGGLTWDGVSLRIQISGNTNKLVSVDPTTGAITKTMSAPSSRAGMDLDYDGSALWLGNAYGNVRRLDPTTGGILSEFSTTRGVHEAVGGIAVLGGEAWIGYRFGGLSVYDVTGPRKGEVAHAEDCAPFRQEELGPSVFVGSQLVILSSLGITYYSLAL